MKPNSHGLIFVERVAAPPGFYLLSTHANDRNDSNEQFHVVKDPIIAFAFEKDDEMSIPYPVTFSGAFTDELYILRPDGVVERPNGMICANYEEWLKFEAERYER